MKFVLSAYLIVRHFIETLIFLSTLLNDVMVKSFNSMDRNVKGSTKCLVGGKNKGRSILQLITNVYNGGNE